MLTGVLYPLAVTAGAQLAFPDKADGSLITKDGKVVGSKLIGQTFTSRQYFHTRPSAADAATGLSSGSNKGPTNEDWLKTVSERVDAYRQANGLARDVAVPVDAVTASGSGLDPSISVANARIQARRVARVRGLDPDAVLTLVERHTERRSLAVLGEDGVNVLELNLALDRG